MSEKSRCEIKAEIGPDIRYTAYSGGYVGPATVGSVACVTHSYVFPPSQLTHGGMLCPIGQIEEATDKALARIATRET